MQLLDGIACIVRKEPCMYVHQVRAVVFFVTYVPLSRVQGKSLR